MGRALEPRCTRLLDVCMPYPDISGPARPGQCIMHAKRDHGHDRGPKRCFRDRTHELDRTFRRDVFIDLYKFFPPPETRFGRKAYRLYSEGRCRESSIGGGPCHPLKRWLLERRCPRRSSVVALLESVNARVAADGRCTELSGARSPTPYPSPPPASARASMVLTACSSVRVLL